jgi:hypothetical protein
MIVNQESVYPVFEAMQICLRKAEQSFQPPYPYYWYDLFRR